MINLEDELKNCFSQVSLTPFGSIESNESLESLNSIESTNSKKFNYQLIIPKELSYFQGHFPNSPVLPAVGMIDMTHYFLSHYFKTHKVTLIEIFKVKIKKPVQPNHQLSLVYETSTLLNDKITNNCIPNERTLKIKTFNEGTQNEEFKVECSWFHLQEGSSNLVAHLSLAVLLCP